MFGAARGLVMFDTPLNAANTSGAYMAAEFVRTDSYFESKQNFQRVNLLGKLTAALNERSTFKLTGTFFSSSWNASGQIPERAVSEGTITRFGSIDPREGGSTQHINANLQYDAQFSDNVRLLVQAYFIDYQFNLFSNFTFFAVDSVRGDMIEQQDRRSVFGGRTELRVESNAFGVRGVTSIGASVRADRIAVGLWHAPNRERDEVLSDNTIGETNLGVYARHELLLSPTWRAETALRGDYFFYNVKDNATQTAQTKAAPILSPKLNIAFTPSADAQFFANIGSGFHSNDARGVIRSEKPVSQIIPRALGAELGARLRVAERVYITAELWGLDLENELVYVGDEGTTEGRGRTRRIGLDLDVRVQFTQWLWLDAGLFLNRGRFLDLPDGENFIPLAPTLTAAGGISVLHPDGFEGSFRVRHLDSRPAIENNSVQAQGWTVFDLAAAYRMKWERVGFTIENLFNVAWNEAQFETTSRLKGEPALVSDLNFTPGTPFSARLTASFFF